MREQLNCICGTISNSLLELERLGEHQRQDQSVCAVGDPDRVADAAILGQRLLQFLYLGPQYEFAVLEDVIDTIVYRRSQLLELPLQVNELHVAPLINMSIARITN